ncbi:MAG: hypothetical protein OSB41_14275, partial [Kiritimatiellae bacterium]|nr:hypothetical protein [Kiritimatiellia bacterium]
MIAGCSRRRAHRNTSSCYAAQFALGLLALAVVLSPKQSVAAETEPERPRLEIGWTETAPTLDGRIA